MDHVFILLAIGAASHRSWPND